MSDGATTGMVGGHFPALADSDHVAPLATRCETMSKPPRRHADSGSATFWGRTSLRVFHSR
jgi:hypothetical protein